MIFNKRFIKYYNVKRSYIYPKLKHFTLNSMTIFFNISLFKYIYSYEYHMISQDDKVNEAYYISIA